MLFSLWLRLSLLPPMPVAAPASRPGTIMHRPAQKVSQAPHSMRFTIPVPASKPAVQPEERRLQIGSVVSWPKPAEELKLLGGADENSAVGRGTRVIAVRCALFALVATGSIAALLAIGAENQRARFSLAIAAAVNLVAAGHYSQILRVRMSSEQWTEAEETVITWLRHSDWLITLPLLVLDLYDLVDSATSGSADPLIPSKYGAAVAAAFVVIFGGLWQATVKWESSWVPALLFIGSMVLFTVLEISIVHPVARIKLPSGPRQDERLAVVLLTLAWVGYPIVALWRFFVDAPIRVEGYGADIVYAGLDVVSKAGLALFLAYRSLWM